MPIRFRQHMRVLAKSLAPAHGHAAHIEGMDARVVATQERSPDGRQSPRSAAHHVVDPLSRTLQIDAASLQPQAQPHDPAITSRVAIKHLFGPARKPDDLHRTKPLQLFR